MKNWDTVTSEDLSAVDPYSLQPLLPEDPFNLDS